MSNKVQNRTDSDSLAGKYLTFNLGNEEYGLEILKVREIVGYQSITSVPKTPREIKGVINLRGQVIPIVDLRSCFEMAEKEVTEQTCIIVVESCHDGRTVPTGVIVDNVSEVLDVGADQIEPAPEFGSTARIDFIHGMAKIGAAVKILLDIDKVLSGKDVSSWMDSATHTAA